MSPVMLFGAYAVMILIVMYTVVYIPNKKKQKKMQELHASVSVGDTVITIAGIVGRVVSRDQDYVTLLIDENSGATMQVVLYAVSQIKERAKPSVPEEAPDNTSGEA